jgi:hypothetical protein
LADGQSTKTRANESFDSPVRTIETNSYRSREARCHPTPAGCSLTRAWSTAIDHHSPDAEAQKKEAKAEELQESEQAKE